MTTIDDGGSAFPCEGGPQSGLHAAPGMSLREWYAGEAMKALIGNAAIKMAEHRTLPELSRLLSVTSVHVADAMIRELKGGGT